MTKPTCWPLDQSGPRTRQPVWHAGRLHTDSALHNGDADPDEEGPGDEWMALEGLRVRSGHDVLVCVGDQKNSEKTEVGACRRALDLGRYTRAEFCDKGYSEDGATRRKKRGGL